MRLLSCREVAQKTTLSVSHIRRLAKDNKFPQPVTITESRVAWPEDAVEAWIKSKIDEVKS